MGDNSIKTGSSRPMFNSSSSFFFFHSGILCLIVTLLTVFSQIDGIAAAKLSACKLQSTSGSNHGACVCNNGDTPDVRCTQVTGMTEVPKDIFPDVQMLVIERVDIENLYPDDFAGYDDITGLTLTNLKLHTINNRPFRNLYKLKYLNLQGNKLTRFDPTWSTYRFLTSMISLDVNSNPITTIHKNSFITIMPVARGTSLTVYLRGTIISCGCDVLSLYRWVLQLEGVFKLNDFLCADKDNRRYDQIPPSEYPQCSAVNVPDNVTCQPCTDLSTNYECNLLPSVRCSDGERCQRSVTYKPGTGMGISSKCVIEATCAATAYLNKDTCLQAMAVSNSFQCTYCCTNDVCGTRSKSDRTNDYKYKLHFYKVVSNVSPALFDTDSKQFKEAALVVKRDLETPMRKFEGGWFFQVERFEPHDKQNVKVVVAMFFTVFNWVKAKQVFTDMEKRLNNYYDNSDNTEIPKGFFRTTTAKCPSENFEFNGVKYSWPETDVDSSARILCTNQDNFNPSQYAYRQCNEAGPNKAQWGMVYRNNCYATTTTSITTLPTTSPSTSETTTTTTITATTTTTTTTTTKPPLSLPPKGGSYTPKQAQVTSNQILSYIEDTDSLTSQDVEEVVDLLEGLSAGKTNLAYGNVSVSVLMCVDGLIGASPDTLRESEQQDKTSSRLLNLIDDVGTNAPLTRGKFEFSSPSLAVAARSVLPSETRSLVFSEVPSANNKMETTVGFNRPADQGSSSIVIPTKSVLGTLTPEQKQAFNRVTFSLHNDSKLFDSVEAPASPNYVKVSGGDEGQGQGSDRFYLKNQVNGRIISASVPGVKIEDLPENITMTFEHTERNSTNPECVYWDAGLKGGLGDWTSRGCGVVRSDSTSTTCGCNHLTNFALLMDVYQEGGGLSDADKQALSIISFIGCGVSLLALILTLVTYSLFRKLRRDTPSKILINLCIALLMSNLIFLAGMQDYTFDNEIACKVVGVLLHYFMLSALTWMVVEAFYMYLALVRVFKAYFSHFLLKISLFGWGVPLIAIAATLAVNSTDNYGLLGSGLCWIKTPAFYYAFGIPVGLILIVNFIAFGLVIRQLMQMSSAKLNTSDRYGTMQRLRGAVGVIILLGLTWVFAVFAIDSASVVFYYLFAIFNSLQGLFIFIFYCVFKADAAASWRRFLSCCFDQTDLGSTSASREKQPKQNGKATSTHNNTRRKSSNSSANNTLSTASTVARGSNGNSSQIYDSIDSSYNANDYNNMTMSHSSQYTTSGTTPPQGSNSMVTKFTSDVDSKKMDHGLNHVYSNQASAYQFDRDTGSPMGQSPPTSQSDPPYIPHPPNNYNQHSRGDIPPYAVVNASNINIVYRHPSPPTPPESLGNVRDIVGQFERSTSSVANTSI